MKWKFYKYLQRERKQVVATISLTSRREFSLQMWTPTDSGWEEESHAQKINLISRPFQARQLNDYTTSPERGALLAAALPPWYGKTAFRNENKLYQ